MSAQLLIQSLQHMRKEHGETLTLQFLERKYQEEKQILMKENKRLKQNLEEEIERGDLLKIKSDQLQRENQKLNAAIAELRGQVENLRQNQLEKETNCQLIRQLQDSIDKIKGLTAEKEELVTLIQRIYNQKLALQKEVEQFQGNQQQLQHEMENLADKHAQFKSQSTRQIEQLLSIKKGLEEEVETTNQKSTEQKKKTKDLQKKMIQLERRLQMSEQLQEKKFTEQVEILRMERDKLYQKSLQLNTKCSLFQSNISQLQKHIDSLEDQLKSCQKKAQLQSDKNYDLKNKLQKQQKIVHQMQEQVQRLKEYNRQLQNERNTVPKQDFIKQMRKNLTDINQMSHKDLKKMTEGPTLRDYPSQSQLGVFIKQDDGLQKAKLQGQITSLQSQIMIYKKQNEILGDELRKLKKHIDEKHFQTNKKQHQIKQLRLKLEREIERGKQILALRKENQNLRGKETQLMQRAKQTAEYETSISLKLAFYQRKIKQNLDNIDRKQSIIEKHKSTVTQLEQRQKHYIETLKRLNDQVESLRAYKQQCNRKDTILKEYKAKNQKFKQEKDETSKQMAKLKSDVTKLRSDKQRFETQLEIRQKELASLKAKQDKLSSEKNDDYYKENTRLKENKNANDHKIKQLKKQKEQLCDALSHIRSIIISKVEEYIAKQIPTDRKKGHEYEAAKLLGLKAGDLEQFLNPGANINRRITLDLQQLWLQGNFVQFTNFFVNYIVAQTQKKQFKHD